MKSKCLFCAIAVLAVCLSLFTMTTPAFANSVPSYESAGSQTPTGWYWPAGTGDTGGWLGFMGWNQAFNGWHLAQDFPLDQGLPVYAIADGEVVLSGTDVGGYGPGGTPGGALVARFMTSAEEFFAALYGHIDNPHAEGKVEAGQILGYTNDYDPPHLHFGIHPGYELAENPWRGYTHNESETYGWVDPVQFLLNNTPPTTTMFADGFESGSFSTWTGRSVTSGETASVVNTMAHHGTYSAKFSSNGNLGTERAYSYKTITSSAELYARGYFRIASSGISANDNRFYFIIFKAGGASVAFAGWRMTGGVAKWTLLIRHGTSWVSVYSTNSPLLNQWYCAELHWKKDAVAGLGELWVDGALACSISGRNTAYYGDANRLDFGLAEIVNCGATTVYGDCANISSSYRGPEPSTTVFEDGFESGSFNNWAGKSNTAGESAIVVNTITKQGIYSGMFTSNGGGGTERAYCYKAISSSTELYASGYFFVSASGIVANDNRFYFLIFKARTQSVAFAGWRMTGGVVKWTLLIRHETSWLSVFSANSPSLNQWYCVELHWKEDASAGLGELWIDGVLVCSASGKNTANYGDVNRVEFGLPELVNCAATTVYGDSCVVSRARIAPPAAALQFTSEILTNEAKRVRKP